MRINAEWYELPFLVISDYSPELLGKELIDEDFYIKTSDNRYLSLNSNLLELKKLTRWRNENQSRCFPL